MKQIHLTSVNFNVDQAASDTRVLMIQEVGPTGPGDLYVIPMPNDVAEKVGQALSAPHVQPATQADVSRLVKP